VLPCARPCGTGVLIGPQRRPRASGPRTPANTKPSLCGDAVDAPEKIRTTTDHAVHKALNLGGRPALRVRSRLLERFQLQLRTVSLKLGPPIGPLGNGAPQRAVTETVARAPLRRPRFVPRNRYVPNPAARRRHGAGQAALAPRGPSANVARVRHPSPDSRRKSKRARRAPRGEFTGTCC